MINVSKAAERSNGADMDAPSAPLFLPSLYGFFVCVCVCSYSQKAIEECVFTDEKLFGVILFGLSQLYVAGRKIISFLWMNTL